MQIRAALLLTLTLLAGPALSAGTAAPQPAGAPDSTAADDANESRGINARYMLMDANGRAVSNEDFPGLFQLIAFGYTFCPDVCPTTLAEIAVIMEQLGATAERMQPLFITVDPERDTAAALRSYTEFFHPRIMGLSGSPDLIRRAADSFKVRYEKVRDPGAPPEQYAVDHSAGIYLLGPDGRYIRKFAYAMPPAEIVRLINEIVTTSETRPAPRHLRPR